MMVNTHDGLRFNTFTQELCLRDALTIPMPPREYQNPQPRLTSPTEPPSPENKTEEDLDPSMSFCAKFVDCIGELADVLNVSGKALLIFTL